MCKDARKGKLCVICTCREFNTSVDIELHKWAESLQLAQLCVNVSSSAETNVRTNLLLLVRGRRETLKVVG